METTARRVALYARASTADQTAENQILELRTYCAARGWTMAEYTDSGVSGAKTTRPQLDAMMFAARRRRFDTLVCWRLDRLGRNLKHLITRLDELQALGIAFVSLAEGIDATTPAGRLQMQILGAIAEFKRERIRERVRAGIARAKRQGKRLGRRRSTPLPLEAATRLTVREAARLWGCGKSQAARRLNAGQTPTATACVA